MSDRSLIAKKIKVEILLDLFNDLYHRGVDFVDISLQIGEERDHLFVSFEKSYMDPEYADNFDTVGEEPTEKIDIKLSDEDIDQIS